MPVRRGTAACQGAALDAGGRGAFAELRACARSGLRVAIGVVPTRLGQGVPGVRKVAHEGAQEGHEGERAEHVGHREEDGRHEEAHAPVAEGRDARGCRSVPLLEKLAGKQPWDRAHTQAESRHEADHAPHGHAHPQGGVQGAHAGGEAEDAADHACNRAQQQLPSAATLNQRPRHDCRDDICGIHPDDSERNPLLGHAVFL
mmetsp:Transcript_31321/g.78358  ORF Transcript_31321/g.78358 Transcript_31321/m.78358 type:complete len:202 (-) Transcript_31321:1033-1638(-)